MAEAQCPSCGAPIQFRIGTSLSQVCASCKSVIVRSDRGLENLGRVADVVGTDSGLALHDRGQFRGKNFEVAGKIVLKHPAGGTWEEYYVSFDGGTSGWITEAQGRWSVVMQVQATPPPIQAMRVQMQVPIGNFGAYVVAEVGHGQFLSADGELPFIARPGSERHFADLSGQNGAVASIDYGDPTQGNRAPLVYIGYDTQLAELNLQRVGIGGRGDQVKAKETKCPSCGAPIPLTSSQTERIACKYCGALSDIASSTVIAQQGTERQKPWIPLGQKGTLENIEWTCIGYCHRSTVIEGESFSWSEYLLYNEQHGYKWLVIDEGVVRLGAAIAAGDVDTRYLPGAVAVRGTTYSKRNGNTATVDYVLGEFYWKVAVGENVWAEDFENGQYMVSSEKNESEVNWTFSYVVSKRDVENAFGIQGRHGLGEASDVVATNYTPGKTGMNGLIIAIVAIFILLMFIGACASACDDGGGGGGSVRFGGGSSGGFGGK